MMPFCYSSPSLSFPVFISCRRDLRSILCGGSKSDKLLACFGLFATGDGADQLLSRRGTWCYLRSFLTVILALSERATSLPANDVFPVIDKEAVNATGKLFKFYNNPSAVTFAEFAEWYILPFCVPPLTYVQMFPHFPTHTALTS